MTTMCNINSQRMIVGLAMLLGLLLAAQSAFAQTGRIDVGSLSHADSRFGFYWETRLTPPSPPLPDIYSTAVAGGPGVVHRVLLDPSTQVYVGYDVVVRNLREAGQYQVTFQTLTMTPELSRQVLGESRDRYRQLRTPGWGLPAPREIRGGEVIELPLLMNSTTGQMVTDYVTIQEPPQVWAGFDRVPDRQFAFAPGSARDFRIDDVELTIEAPRLSINGKLDETSARRFDKVSGSVVWIYTAKRGRYILSLVARPDLGFRRAGEVRGSSLSFAVAGETFNLSTGQKIAPGQTAFNLYVLYEPDWKPSYPNADLGAFNMGAADRAETLLRK